MTEDRGQRLEGVLSEVEGKTDNSQKSYKLQ